MNVTLRWFQYQLLHRIIPTNSYMYNINVVHSNVYNFMYNHSTFIFYCYCAQRIYIWRLPQNIWSRADVNINLSNAKIAIFGGDFAQLLNIILIAIKDYISCCKEHNVIPSVAGLKTKSGLL